MNFFTKHLKDVNEGYFEHARKALCFGINLFKAALAVTLHALLPFVFLTTGSRTVRKLHNLMILRSEIAMLRNCNSKNKIAIIGFGASGISTFCDLIKNSKNQELIIDIFDKNFFCAKGIAYSTKNFSHILNVEAGKMSIETDNADSFINWLKNNNYNYQTTDFAPRVLYGLYLEDIVAKTCKLADEKGIKYNFITTEINDVQKQDGFFIIDNKPYKHLILATGVEIKNFEKNFWNDDLNKYLNDAEIHIAGTGLTAFDAIVSLVDKNYSGKIFAYSRSGLVTKKRTAYDKKVTPPLTAQDADLELSQIFRKFVKACKSSEEWQAVIDSMRPITQEDFWIKFSAEKKRRFVRHCLKHWSIYRHRCPERQYVKLEKLMAEGKLVFVKGKITSKKFIDCTGFDFRFPSVLIKNMVENRLLNRDELDMGVVSNSPSLHIIGGLNFGTLLETTAVPDITKQAGTVGATIRNN